MKETDKNFQYFTIVSATGIVLTFLYWIISGNGTAVFDWLVLGESDSWELADFFRHIGYSADLSRTYWISRDACFPPLTYLFFHLLYRMNLDVFSSFDPDDWQAFTQAPYAILLYIFFVALFCVSLLVLVYQTAGLTINKSMLVCILLLMSFPFQVALERGNPVLITVILLLLAVYWMDADCGWKREAALVLIAIAVNFKLYPAIMAALYVKRKRYAEAGRLAVYSMVLFVVPFFFTGGVGGFIQYLDVLLHGHYNAGFMREWSSVRGICYVMGARMGLADEACVLLGQILENIFLLLSVLGMWKARKRWKELFFLSSIMCFYMPTSWVYNTVYMVIPLISFLPQKAESTRTALCYPVLFGLSFTLPIWCLMWNVGTWVCIMFYLIWGLLMTECVRKKVNRE